MSPFSEGVTVSRRTRRVLPLVLPLLLVGLGVACVRRRRLRRATTPSGDLSSVTIKGDVGTDPEVTFDGKVEVDKTTTEVITEGDGEEIEAGDSVLAHIWIGNGFTQEKAFSTYEEEPKTPQLLTADEKALSPLFVEGARGPHHRLPRRRGCDRRGRLRPAGQRPAQDRQQGHASSP